jgi:hypothetical protein
VTDQKAMGLCNGAIDALTSRVGGFTKLKSR